MYLCNLLIPELISNGDDNELLNTELDETTMLSSLVVMDTI